MNEDTTVVLIIAIGIFLSVGIILALLVLYVHEMGKK